MLKHSTGKPFRDVFDKPEIVEMLASLIDIFSKQDNSLTTGYCAVSLFEIFVKFVLPNVLLVFR